MHSLLAFQTIMIMVYLVGLAGLGVLTATALSESFLTETSVIIFTLVGSAFSFAHTKNFQLCKELDCDYHDVVLVKTYNFKRIELMYSRIEWDLSGRKGNWK